MIAIQIYAADTLRLSGTVCRIFSTKDFMRDVVVIKRHRFKAHTVKFLIWLFKKLNYSLYLEDSTRIDGKASWHNTLIENAISFRLKNVFRKMFIKT